MTERAPDVTEAELSVMEELWRESPRTIRDLAVALYPPGDPGQYATVQKLLDRLENKGFVTRQRAGRAHEFAPLIDRDTLISRRLSAVANQLCGGALSPLFTNLIRRAGMKPDELAELTRLIERLDDDMRGAR